MTRLDPSGDEGVRAPSRDMGRLVDPNYPASNKLSDRIKCD